MPIYSEPLSDGEILKLLKDNYNHVLLLGCGSCMNESLAYKNDLPIFAKDESGKIVSYAVHSELIRLTNFLKEQGVNTRYELLPEGSNSRCMLNYSEELYPLPLYPRPEIIVSLGCPSCKFGIEMMSDGVPVVKATRQLGYLAYGHVTEADGTRRIIKEKSRLDRY